MGEWQPIETAPTGLPVLVFGSVWFSPGIQHIAVAEHFVRNDGSSYWMPLAVSGYEWEFDITPTHWAPLPNPPSIEEQQ